MAERERLIVSKSGEVHSIGIQYAGKRLVVPYRDKSLLVVKEMPGKAWDGNGSPWKNTRATLFVYRIISEKPLKRNDRVDVFERDPDKAGRREIVAFPGGAGTHDMTSRARFAGVPVLEVHL